MRPPNIKLLPPITDAQLAAIQAGWRALDAKRARQAKPNKSRKPVKTGQPNSWSGRFPNGSRVRSAYQLLLRYAHHFQTGEDPDGARLFRNRPGYLKQAAFTEWHTLEQPEQGRFTPRFRAGFPHLVKRDTETRKHKRKSHRSE